MRPLLLLLTVLLFSAPAFANDVLSRDSLSDEDKIFGLSHFWREATYNFGHKDQVPDLDWDAAYQTFIPRVLATKTDLDYYQELERFSALLKDGHTNIHLPRDMWESYDRMRVSLSYLDGKVVVDNVDKSLSDTLPIGSEVLRFDGQDVHVYMNEVLIPRISTSAPHMYPRIAINWLIRGPQGTSATLSFQRPDGRQSKAILSFDRKASDFEWERTPSWNRDKNIELKWLEDDIARVNINSFDYKSVVPDFEKILPELRKSKALIIDIRANRGGNSGRAAQVLHYLTDKPFKSSKWRTPQHIAAYKAWGKGLELNEDTKILVEMAEGRGYHYGEGNEYPAAENPVIRPMAILFGSDTASSAENMLVMADEFENLTTFGTPSYGSTGQPLHFDLPGGASAQISTKRDYYQDGREFIGRGVQPDVFIEMTIDDFRAGRDPVLKAAITHLETEIAK